MHTHPVIFLFTGATARQAKGIKTMRFCDLAIGDNFVWTARAPLAGYRCVKVSDTAWRADYGYAGVEMVQNVNASVFDGMPALTTDAAAMENIGIACLAIAEMAHEWAEDLAGERGRDYDAVRARLGQRNVYFRDALEEMQWQAEHVWDVLPGDIDPSFEIEF